jgi:hypothetical protein
MPSLLKGNAMTLLDIGQKLAFCEEYEDALDTLYFYLSRYEKDGYVEVIITILEALYSGAIAFDEHQLSNIIDLILENILCNTHIQPEAIKAIYELCDIKIYPIYSTPRLIN